MTAPRALHALLARLRAEVRREDGREHGLLNLLTLNELRIARIAPRDGENGVVETLLARAQDRLAAGWTERKRAELDRAERADKRLITVPHTDDPGDLLHRVYVLCWRDPLDPDRWRCDGWHVEAGWASWAGAVVQL